MVSISFLKKSKKLNFILEKYIFIKSLFFVICLIKNNMSFLRKKLQEMTV